MKTQLSRNSFNASNRYSGVYQQMGRMLTDADWNEWVDLDNQRLASVLDTVIGSGTPRQHGLVKITELPDNTKEYDLCWGKAFVNGVFAQLRPNPNASLADPTGQSFEYPFQADYPQPPALPGGEYLLYLDVWERAVTALEDPELRDPGLQGADTCTRTQTMAQVKWCETGVDPEDEGQNPTIGEALLTLVIRQGSTEPDPCDPCAEEIALQDKLGNYLFRVEVHAVDYDASGEPEGIVLKWSSENGAEHFAIGNEAPGFIGNTWAYEFYHGYQDPAAVSLEDYASEKHLGRHLAPGFTPHRGELRETYPDTVPAGYTAVRRWDGYCELRKSGSQWQLQQGVDRGVVLSADSDGDAHGHVSEGSSVVVNLDALTLTLELASLPVLSGDFWYADIRQAVNVAGDTLLENRAPEGIRHHYMTLGTVSAGQFIAYDAPDCKRFEFPPLTDINADDVCYDPSECANMPNVDTVQEAIDHLCKARDLRWHNKHLHGWGIVCGLVVHCGPNPYDDPDDEDEDPARRHVTVGKGYAITCEGDDIVLSDSRHLDLMTRIEALQEAGQIPLTDGNGSVCLRLDLGDDGLPEIGVEPYDAARHGNDSLFEGTLLMDFVQHCIMDVITALREEFDFLDSEELEEGENGKVLVSEARKKYISFVNLVIQLLNPGNGSYVFLSHKEHRILRSLYQSLQQLLKSKTFCAMYEGQEFPPYPFENLNASTFFGKHLHTRVTLHPSNRFVYTYGGTDNTINVYEVASEKLVQVIEMPSAEGAEVTAITFMDNGNLMVAAASVRGVDSVFGLARVNDKHSWEQMTILCDIEITEMQTSERDRGLIYAVGKGRGLFYLRPEVLMEEEKPQPDPELAFNAVGHLRLDEEAGRAYCTSNGQADEETDQYDQVLVINLRESTTPTFSTISLFNQQEQRLLGEDGIALKPGRASMLYVVVEDVQQNQEKLLLTFDLNSANGPQRVSQLALEDTQIAPAYHANTDQVLLAMEDGYRIQVVNATGKQTVSFRVPVQIQPVDLAIEQQSGEVFALNFISNTLSRVPQGMLVANEEFLQQLAEYRIAILQAFYALFGGLLQYLKDCFCDHLLVRCPSCDDEDVIYLATVEIRDNEIYNICNFDKRKYVKSFPTMGYWFSLIPIWPMLKMAVGKFCCAVLPNMFDNQRDTVIAPQPPTAVAPANNRVKAKTARNSIQTYQRTDVRAETRNQLKTTSLVGRLASDGALNLTNAKPKKQPGVRKQALMESDVNDAVKTLNNNRIEVAGVKPYRANDATKYLTEYTATPQRIPPGSKVTLYQEKGKVAFYSIEKPADVAGVSIDENLKQEISQLESRKSQLADFSGVNAELAKVETRRAGIGELETMKSDINQLKNEKSVVEEELAALKSQVTSIKTERSQLQADLQAMNQSMAEAGEKQRQLKVEFEKNRPVGDLGEVTPAVRKELETAGIRTIGELAGSRSTTLRNLPRINEAKATTLINAAKTRTR